MVSNPVVEEVEGVVDRTNERGFTLEGRDGWLNLSKYASPAPVIPDEGARVIAGLDKAGYVRIVEVLEPAIVYELREDTAPAGQPPDRDHRILRQAVLNSAIHTLASGEPADPDEVLRLAERYEAWVLR